MSNEAMILNRRQALLLFASMGTALFPAYADSEAALPGGNLLTFMRMRGMSTRPVAMGCLAGIYSGVVDGAVTPLLGVVSATFASYREADGGFEIRSAEVAYFTDLQMQSVLDEWKNPYTDEVLRVPVSSLPPSVSRIDRNLSIDSAAARTPGLTFRHNVAKPQIIGREVWFTETVAALRTAGPSEAAFHYEESTVLRSRLADLDKHGASPVPCDTGYESVSSWRTWMNMASHPGSVVGFGNGFYGASMEDLPPAWIRATEKSRPDLLANPASILEANSHPGR